MYDHNPSQVRDRNVRMQRHKSERMCERCMETTALPTRATYSLDGEQLCMRHYEYVVGMKSQRELPEGMQQE